MSEGRILFLLGAVQFINVMDFMMVIPLGPDFAAALGIPTAKLGLVAGAYTGAAAVAGAVGALFLDRFDRRRALGVAMMGLVVGTAAGGLADGLGGMVAARIWAGAFGGPASALALAILADVVPAERRGRAMGKVAGAFAVASVLGVPAGLELARIGGWRAPFFTVAGLGLVVAAGAIALMPPLPRHLDGGAARVARPLVRFLADPAVLLALGSMAALMIGTFALIANLSAFLQFNLGYPRARLGFLYMAGGAVSFVAMRAAGVLIDRHGPVPVAAIGTVLFSLAISALFLPAHPVAPIAVLFAAIMMSNSIRVVALSALNSRVPAPQERARFMSAQSAIQHLAIAIGAVASSAILHERPSRALDRIPHLAVAAILIAGTMPFLMAEVVARVRRRDEARAPA